MSSSRSLMTRLITVVRVTDLRVAAAGAGLARLCPAYSTARPATI
jgi:hypothetical protein